MGILTPTGASKATRLAIQKLSNRTFSGLTPSRLLEYDDGRFLSVDPLTDYIAGTANEVDITDDGDGTVTIGIVNPLIVSKGGTGAASLTDHSILLGSGTSAITALGAATNGQLPIGSTGNDPVLATLTEGTGITITNGAGSISIAASVDFASNISGTANQITVTDDGDNTVTLSIPDPFTVPGVLNVTDYMAIADAAAQLNISCHLYKVWNMTSAADNTFRKGLASNIQAGKTGAADYTSHVDGIATQVQLDDVNTQNWTNEFGLRGVSIEVNTEGDASGTLTGVVGILMDANFQDSMTVTNYYGIYHDAVFDANSKLVNSYGIYLEDFDKATTLNYAIYTNAGLVRLGDDTDVVGDFTASTIQADNGFTGSWVNNEGDTVTVTGGVITDVS